MRNFFSRYLEYKYKIKTDERNDTRVRLFRCRRFVDALSWRNLRRETSTSDGRHRTFGASNQSPGRKVQNIFADRTTPFRTFVVRFVSYLLFSLTVFGDSILDGNYVYNEPVRQFIRGKRERYRFRYSPPPHTHSSCHTNNGQYVAYRIVKNCKKRAS